ncbi:MAG: hypothetical protein ABJC12_01830 [Saprospiraceae bacterium]
MKKLFFTSLLSLVVVIGFSQNYSNYNTYQPRPYKDIYGNSYSNYNNLYKDTDKDGLMNVYDNNDKSSNIYKSYDVPTNNYTSPSYNYTAPTYYTPSTYDTYSTKTIYTGPQGGQYYINSNGNKTYIRRS